MPEKIFDIYPPKFVPPSEPEKIPQKISRKKPSKRKGVLLLILGIFIIIGFFAYFFLSRAQIEIWPETQALNLKERIEINAEKDQPDFLAKVFPGKIFEEELEISQEFSASGKVSKTERARGQIRVYNAYSDSPQVLIVNTRFISADGKLFRSVERVTIPGGKYDEKGKLVPGLLDINVIAAEPGEEYNIGLSTFSIPGFAGTPKYTAFYGKSFSAMTGGYRGEAPQVTQTDLDKAKDALIKKLFEEGNTALKNKAPLDFVLLDEALSQKIIEIEPSVSVGSETQTFKLGAKANLKVLSFRKSDLENFAKEFIVSQMPQDEILAEEGFWSKKKTQEDSLKINYKFYSIDWQLKKMILDLDFSAKIYPDINENVLKKAILGKSLKETQILLTNQPYVEKSEVKLWPFWVKKIPQDKNKIKIKLNID